MVFGSGWLTTKRTPFFISCCCFFSHEKLLVLFILNIIRLPGIRLPVLSFFGNNTTLPDTTKSSHNSLGALAIKYEVLNQSILNIVNLLYNKKTNAFGRHRSPDMPSETTPFRQRHPDRKSRAKSSRRCKASHTAFPF
jgi:hypothetical protein